MTLGKTLYLEENASFNLENLSAIRFQYYIDTTDPNYAGVLSSNGVGAVIFSVTDINDLQDQINTEKSRIDAILNLSVAELDTLREISDAYQAADSDITTLLTNVTADLNALKLVVNTLATNL